MIINEYFNFYTNEVSKEVADELIARMDALSALNRNVSEYGSSKQFFAVRDKNSAKPELLRKFQEWQYRKIAYGEVKAFRFISQCCKGQLVKEREEAPFVVTVQYDNKNGTVPDTDNGLQESGQSYGDIKYSVADGLNRPSLYNRQPQVFLQSINVSNEGYAGVVQRVVLKMRVFTREAFEVVDKWFLRPGNEMLVKFGWSVPLTSMETSSDVIHAVIFNFNATLADDTGWIITVHGIAKGNLAVGLALGSSAEETAALNNNINQTKTLYSNAVPNLTTILKDELNRLLTGFPGLAESDVSNIYNVNIDLDPNGKPYGIVYESDIFPHGIGRVKFSIDGKPSSLSLPDQFQSAAQINPTLERRQATDEELDRWLDGFRKTNERFRNLEQEFGKKSPTAFIKFYEGNFGLISNGIFADTAWPERSEVRKTEEFINGRNPEKTELTPEEQAAGQILRKEIFYQTAADVAGTRTADIAVQQQVEKNNRYALERPPFGPIRRKVLNIMYKELPDNRSDEQKNLELQLQEQQNQASQTNPAIQAANARITDPQSTAKYFICLGDLVYFFNEKVLKKAPELYDAVQFLVENQPTSYDGNLVSCLPADVMFSNARNTQGGMSSYGASNSINYGFKYKKVKATNELIEAFGCDGADFYTGSFFNSKDDMKYHREDWGIYLKEHSGEKVAAFNIAHIWVSVDVISEAYSFVLQDKAIDPQYKTVFDFFERIFSKIAQASGGATQLTFIPDNNQLYSNKTFDSKELSLKNPLLKKTQMFRIIDVNYQVPDNLPFAPRSFDFKINDVNATILRDVDIALKIPSKLQTVAYTYGRSGMNEDIVDIDESPDGPGGICNVDFTELIRKREEIYAKLYIIKDEISRNLSPDNIEKLVNITSQYVANPKPFSSDANDTTTVVANHQGWIYSKLYPIELKFKIDGIAGFLYGNKVNVLNALPSRYSDRVYFTLTKIEHEIQNNDWVTTLTGIARLKNSNGLIQFPKLTSRNGSRDLCDGIPDETPGNAPNSPTFINITPATQFNVIGSGGGTVTVLPNTSTTLP